MLWCWPVSGTVKKSKESKATYNNEKYVHQKKYWQEIFSVLTSALKLARTGTFRIITSSRAMYFASKLVALQGRLLHLALTFCTLCFLLVIFFVLLLKNQRDKTKRKKKVESSYYLHVFHLYISWYPVIVLFWHC